MDGLLVASELLIAKKQATKLAATQRFLTGKIRQSRFKEEWTTRSLGGPGVFSTGRGISREDVSNEGLPCCRYGERYIRYENHILKIASRIPPSVALTALPIGPGDLLSEGAW